MNQQDYARVAETLMRERAWQLNKNPLYNEQWSVNLVEALAAAAALCEAHAAPVDEADYIDILFDGPPSHESGRFIEVENSKRQGIKFGEWVHRDDGYWVLRFARSDARAKVAEKQVVTLVKALREVRRCWNEAEQGNPDAHENEEHPFDFAADAIIEILDNRPAAVTAALAKYVPVDPVS